MRIDYRLTLKLTKIPGLAYELIVSNTLKQRFIPNRAPISLCSKHHFNLSFKPLLMIKTPDHPQYELKYPLLKRQQHKMTQNDNSAKHLAPRITTTHIHLPPIKLQNEATIGKTLNLFGSSTPTATIFNCELSH